MSPPRFRFGIRTLLIVMALLAIILAGPRAYDWYYSVPLKEAVDAFNAHTLAPSHLALLTEGELVASILLHLPTLEASDEVKGALTKTARLKLLPPNAVLSMTTLPGKSYGIDIDLMLDATHGYSFRVRHASALLNW